MKRFRSSDSPAPNSNVFSPTTVEYLPVGTHLESQEVDFDSSPPYCKGQNGLAERTNRTIWERVNTLLSDANLPSSWGNRALGHFGLSELARSNQKNVSPIPNDHFKSMIKEIAKSEKI